MMGKQKGIKETHIRKFEKLSKQLDRLMHDIRDYRPEANLYVEGDGFFNLLEGPSHDTDGSHIEENVVSGVKVHKSSGGDWL